MFSHIVGNEAIKSYLSNAIAKGAIGNSLLFAGPEGVGKELFANAFAEAVLCVGDNAALQRQKLDSGNHPDLHLYRPEGKIGMHSIQSMRQLSEEVYLPPYESERKVFIIHEAERMLPSSSNALLKTFEEPSPDTVIILISSSPDHLLPTILSRCRTVYFRPLSCEENRINSTAKNEFFDLLQPLLIKGKFDTYTELVAKAKELAEVIESKNKEIESAARALRLRDLGDKMTALQCDSLDKELEGVVAMQTAIAASQLFEAFLAWHRDLLLLSVNGNPDYLMYNQSIESLKIALEAKRMIPLEHLIKAIESAKLALARSTAFHLCLETFLIKIGFI